MNVVFTAGFEIGVLVGMVAGAVIVMAVVGLLLKRAVIG